MLGCSLSEVWGDSYEGFTNPPKVKKTPIVKKEKFKQVPNRLKYQKETFERDSDTESESDEDDNNKESSDYDLFLSDSDSDIEDIRVREQLKNKQVVKKKHLDTFSDKNINLKELYTQFNNLEANVNKFLGMVSEKFHTDKPDTTSNDSKNVYDIVLFVIFGLFVLLILESISKLVFRYVKPTLD
tara:strand:- start:2574 stop:3128 length:555 start_codon:yes stop_codon:yes gene_type:complete